MTLVHVQIGCLLSALFCLDVLCLYEQYVASLHFYVHAKATKALLLRFEKEQLFADGQSGVRHAHEESPTEFFHATSSVAQSGVLINHDGEPSQQFLSQHPEVFVVSLAAEAGGELDAEGDNENYTPSAGGRGGAGAAPGLQHATTDPAVQEYAYYKTLLEAATAYVFNAFHREGEENAVFQGTTYAYSKAVPIHTEEELQQQLRAHRHHGGRGGGEHGRSLSPADDWGELRHKFVLSQQSPNRGQNRTQVEDVEDVLQSSVRHKFIFPKFVGVLPVYTASCGIETSAGGASGTTRTTSSTEMNSDQRQEDQVDPVLAEHLRKKLHHLLKFFADMYNMHFYLSVDVKPALEITKSSSFEEVPLPSEVLSTFSCPTATTNRNTKLWQAIRLVDATDLVRSGKTFGFLAVQKKIGDIRNLGREIQDSLTTQNPFLRNGQGAIKKHLYDY
ncbi:unnamed protein product, partial [Amoebophrya sp. A120]